MSANIYWRPKKKNKSLGISAPSSFIESMTNVFGKQPWSLNLNEDLSKLDTMISMGFDGAELRDVLLDCEDIEVWSQY